MQNKSIRTFFSLKNKRIIIHIFWIAPLLFFLFLPSIRFKKSHSTVLLDSDNQLLGASIAQDGQWRFPEVDSVPYKFEHAILLFEDKHFYQHFGFNPVSFARALYINLKSGRIKQGGSTLTMQTVRLSRDNPSRTIGEKILEIFLSLRSEITLSKTEILSLYASHAPFGGNVVGLEAASWRYFGRKPHELSWGESALLAVLPNSPSLIYPGKNHKILLAKRNRLLRKLLAENKIDIATCELAEIEPLPQAPKPLPRLAPHLLDRVSQNGFSGQRIVSSIRSKLQVQTTNLLQYYHSKLKSNSIHNGAILVMEVKTGKVLAYVGNTLGEDPSLGHDMDLIAAERSYGSLLKPILYAAMLEEGTLLPKMLVADIPTNMAGYRPHNFFKEYDGAVPANEVLARSLNVPSVRMLHQYGTQRFHTMLQHVGISTLSKPAGHYGLSIILGGGEATLWDLTGMYASMARSLIYEKTSFASPILLKNSILDLKMQQPQLSPASMYLTLDAIAESKRPGNEGQWLDFATSQKISWKTGTSYGSRDAWAIGVSGKYAVGVWLGNASGEGRAGLTGVGTAAPLMFDVFELLPKSKPLSMPRKGFITLPICSKSGFKASANCERSSQTMVQNAGMKAAVCPFHALIHVDKSEIYRVGSDCESVSDMKHKTWFVLPAIQEWYYKSKHPDYFPLPDWRPDCQTAGKAQKNMEIIYPRRFARIFIPKEIDGKLGKTVFEVAHRKPETIIFWHVDDDFLSETRDFHQISVQLDEGWHTLTLVDAHGESCQVKFEVLGKRK